MPITVFQIISGWFKDTLPLAPIIQSALLNINAGRFDSTKLVLECFYNKVTPNGMIIFNDFGYRKGCQRGVDEFIPYRKNKTIDIYPISEMAFLFRKAANFILIAE